MIGAIASSLRREAETISLTPLDNAHSLISALCWRAAYNEDTAIGLWIANLRVIQRLLRFPVLSMVTARFL